MDFLQYCSLHEIIVHLLIVHLPFIQMDSDRDILHIIHVCLDIQTQYIESHLE